MTEYFDLAASLARAEAARTLPDATSSLSRYLDGEFGSIAEARRDAYEKAKEAETDDLALSYLDTADPEISAKLVRMFWEETEELTPVQIISAIRETPGLFKDALTVAAKRLAVSEWTRRYGQ